MDHEAEWFGWSVDFVLKWEGGYWDGGGNPLDEVNFGITRRWFPHLDIKNLKREEAVQIYYTHYWRPSNVVELGWPRCLIALDTSVNMGVAAYQSFWRESNAHPLILLGLRLQRYTKDKRWPEWGAGWTNRVADLIITVSPWYGAGPILP